MHRPSPLRVALVAGTAAALLGASSLPASAHAREVPAPAVSMPRLRLLAPTGRNRVGTVSISVADPARHGRTMVQLFYPTLAKHGRPAPYLPPKTTRLTAAALHLPVRLVATVDTHALSAPRAPRAATRSCCSAPG